MNHHFLMSSRVAHWACCLLVGVTLCGCDLFTSRDDPAGAENPAVKEGERSSGEKQLSDLSGTPVEAVSDDKGQPETDETEGSGRPTAAGSPNAGSSGSQNADSPTELPAHPFPGRSPAPSLDGGVAWLNTAAPIELRSLRGKFVLLDFWTYCCINCMHVLPELKKLEEAYPDRLVVIGVHSAKFDKEKDSKNIREAIQRYEIEHPVVNDAEMVIWDRYGVQSWPTMVLIDPEGNYVGSQSGELTFEMLSRILEFATPYYRRKGALDEKPLKFDLERDRMRSTPLRFPGKVLADVKSSRLFISDSNHNRIVVADLAGKLLHVIGSGKIGHHDGDFAACSFNRPQGMALVGNVLFVADTENHLLRGVDLKTQRVETIAGTGSQRRSYNWPGSRGGGDPRSPSDESAKTGSNGPRFAAPARTTAINSPWALWAHGEDLYIAMAGAHQIWRMTLDEAPPGRMIGPYAGNGREDIVDGRLTPPYPYAPGYASFAQPSGLSSDGRRLFVADSEGASIRSVPLPGVRQAGSNGSDKSENGDASPAVTTIVGAARLPFARLFTFGDRDGQGLLSLRVPSFTFEGEAQQVDGPLLQHPLDVAYHDGKLYVADTYNDKVKVIELATSEVKTVDVTSAGDGEPIGLDEPAGLALAAGKLFVADTNNHRVCVVDLERDNRISVFTIEGLEPPKREE